MDKEVFDELLKSNDVTTLCASMVDLAFDKDTDFPWFEGRCVALLMHPAQDVRGLAATCLGHVAQHTGTLSADTVALLRALKNDLSIGGRIQDALDDWQQFARHDVQVKG